MRKLIALTITFIPLGLLLIVLSASSSALGSQQFQSGGVLDRVDDPFIHRNEETQIYSNGKLNSISSAGWYSHTWSYRLPVTITNNCGGEQEDYQVQVILDSAFDFNHALPDGSDLRVTATDGVNLIPTWIESWDSIGGSASIWVKLPTLPDTGTTIYLYYGNDNPVPPPLVDVPPIGPWEKTPGNPIQPIGGPAGGDGLLGENIVYDSGNDRYWMSVANYSDSSVSLMYSDDPGNPNAWYWYGSIVNQANAPHILEYNGTWYVFYADRGHGGPPYPISVSTSDEISGTYTYTGTILTSTEPWEAYRVDEPYVFQRNDGKWILMYMGDEGGTTELIGYAEADDLLGPYIKYANNPVIDFGPPGSFDAGTVADAWVIELDGVYYIGYTVSDTKTRPWRTAYATTSDWQTFIKEAIILGLGPAGAWDDYSAFRGAVTRDGNTFYFPYTGNDGTIYRTGLATQPAIMPAPINDPVRVFNFFDDFDGDSLDETWIPGYTGTGNHTIVVNNGTLTMTADAGSSSGYVELYAPRLAITGTLMEVYASHPDADLDAVGETDTAGELGFKIKGFNNVIRMMDFPHTISYTYQTISDGNSTGYQQMNDPFDAGWHMYSVSRTPDQEVTFQVDDNPPTLVTSTQTIPTIQLQPWLMSYARDPEPQSRFIIDWIRVRNFCGTDPDITFGGEQVVIDLGVSKTDNPDPLLIGEVLTYTLSINNSGYHTATNVRITDTLPVEVELITAIPEQGTCNQSTPVTCDLGAIPIGGETSVTVEVTTIADGTIDNLVEVVSSIFDPLPGNNSDTESTTVLPVSDLAIEKTDFPDPVVIGHELTYTVLVTNEGPSLAQDVVMTDTLPSQAWLISATPEQGTCGADNPLLCDLNDIPNGESVNVVIVVTPLQDGEIYNSAIVASPAYDPDMVNNFADETTSVASEADLSIDKESNPDPVIAGNILTYTLDVTNIGPSEAENVVLDDDLPDQVSYLSGSPGCSEDGGTVSCDLGNLDPTAMSQATIIVQVDSSTHLPLINQASVYSDTPDPIPANNITTETTQVDTSADLAIDIIDEPDPAHPGGTLTYTLMITNFGPSDAANLGVVDILPDGVNYRYSVPMCTKVVNTITCQMGTLSAGENTQVIIVVSVNNNQTFPLINQASVSSNTTDPDESNNQATEETTIDSIPPTVSWIAPVGDDGIYYSSGETVTLVATATDDVGVESIIFLRWDQVNNYFIELGIDNTPPYQIQFDTSELYQGFNELKLRAYDIAGNSAESKRILIFHAGTLIYIPLISR
jgi:uncharacterized repeat protein (TIGR01451 family)